MKPRKLLATLATTALFIGAASISVANARVSSGGVRGVTDTSIKVAGLAQTSQFNPDDIKLGVEARFKVENDKGGVFGRQLQYSETADDKADASTNNDEARRLVQQEQVFAVVPVLTPYLGQAAKFFEQQHVPFLGWAIAEAWCDNNYGFGFTGCIVPPDNIPTTATTWGALVDKHFKAKGDAKGAKGKTAAVVTESSDTGKKGNIVITAGAKKAGMKVVYHKNAIPEGTVTDYSPYVTDIMSSNKGGPPDVILLVTSVPNTFGLNRALKEAGFTGILTNAVSYDPTIVSVAKGESVFTQFDVPEDTSNPAMQEIVANIRAVNPDRPIGQPTLTAYFSADYFISILKKVGKNLTPEKFAKVAAHFTYEIPGVVGPTKYPAGRKQGAPCGTLTDSDGAKYTIVVPYDCYSNFNFKTGKKLKY